MLVISTCQVRLKFKPWSWMCGIHVDNDNLCVTDSSFITSLVFIRLSLLQVARLSLPGSCVLLFLSFYMFCASLDYIITILYNDQA